MSAINTTWGNDYIIELAKTYGEGLAELYNNAIDDAFKDEIEILNMQKETFTRLISGDLSYFRTMDLQQHLKEIDKRLVEINDIKMNFKVVI